MTSALHSSSIDGAIPCSASACADVRAEFQALVSGCGVYALQRAKIALTGGDRVRWLNGMVTNNVRDLAPNRGVYCFVLNAQGHIQGDLYAYNLADSLLLETGAGQREKLIAHFDKFIIMDDVEVADRRATLASIGLSGPKAQQAMRAAGILTPDLASLELCTPKCECACDCLECTVVRGDDPTGNSFEIWLAPDKLKSTWDGLVAAGATAVGADAVERRRIGLGIPRYGVDIRERDLPQETGQMRALSFTKGCYLGQEIVERIRSRGAVHRNFSVFTVEGPLPEAGTKIRTGDKEAGEITSSAILPLPGGDRSVALGYLRREGAGKELHAGESRLVPATVPPAP